MCVAYSCLDMQADRMIYTLTGEQHTMHARFYNIASMADILYRESNAAILIFNRDSYTLTVLVHAWHHRATTKLRVYIIVPWL